MNTSDILNAPIAPGQIGIFYLGQVGYLIKFNGQYILIDAYLSDYVDKYCCTEQVKWVRSYAPPIVPEALTFADHVFCTHAHSDHMDPETLSAISSVNSKAQFYVSNALTGALHDAGVPSDRIIGLKADTDYALSPDISVRMIPSAHEELHTDENGDPLEAGFLFAFGSATLYHAGDSCPYDGLLEKIDGTDIMILPVNGRDYFRTHTQNIIGNFTAREAVLYAKHAKAKLLIPSHYDLYSVNRIHPAEFVTELFELNPMQRFHMFVPGEMYIYEGSK